MKRRRIAPVLALLLCLLVQGVQAMPVLWRMQCLMSGRSVTSWGTARSCMPERNAADDTTVDAQCCLFSHVNTVREAQQAPQTIQVPDRTPVLFQPLAPAVVAVLLATPMPTWRDRPPPDTGAARVLRIRALLL